MFKKLLLYPLLIITGLAFAGTQVTWNGSSYTVPSVGEENWFGSDKVDGLLISLANNGFQKTGGTFTLSSEVDFGASAGLTGLYFGTRSANDSTSGIFRLSNNEYIGWRNAANGANLLLGVDTSNNLTFNGTSLMSSSGLVPVSSGGTGIASYAVGDLVYATPNSQTLAKLPIGTTDYVVKSNGTVPVYGQVVNASVDNSAAIARSKLATGTADHVVINSGAGAFSSEATLATSRGGTNIASYTTGDILYASNASTLAKLGIGSAGNILKVSGGLPSWGSAAATLATATKTTNYTLTSSDDLILVSPTAGLLIAELPLASANAGKVFHVKRITPNRETYLAKVSAASGDTLDGSMTFLSMASELEYVSIVSDGGTTWRIIGRGHVKPTQQRFTSGSGTYTTPNGVIYLRVRMTGAGGGGSGGGVPTPSTASTGGDTTFGTSLLTATGGAGGEWGQSLGVSGGTGTINSPAFGTTMGGGLGAGSPFVATAVGVSVVSAGGAGGSNPMGGSTTPSVSTGSSNVGRTNSGSGGAGGLFSAAAGGEGSAGGGGGAGGYVDAYIPSPGPSYSYSVGASGAGSAGTGSGGAGGAGAAGYIEVTEYYH